MYLCFSNLQLSEANTYIILESYDGDKENHMIETCTFHLFLDRQIVEVNKILTKQTIGESILSLINKVNSDHILCESIVFFSFL